MKVLTKLYGNQQINKTYPVAKIATHGLYSASNIRLGYENFGKKVTQSTVGKLKRTEQKMNENAK